jgi:hypothetical protein
MKRNLPFFYSNSIQKKTATDQASRVSYLFNSFRGSVDPGRGRRRGRLPPPPPAPPVVSLSVSVRVCISFCCPSNPLFVHFNSLSPLSDHLQLVCGI